MSQVAILGVGRAGEAESVSSQSINELVFSATKRALDDAAVSRSQVDSVVLAAHDVDDGRGITSMTVAGAAGAFMKDEMRVAEDGVFGVAAAASRLLGGHYSISLVVSWGKASESDQDVITQLGYEPFFDRPIAQNEKVALAMQAMAYRSTVKNPDVDAVARRWVDARLEAARALRPDVDGADASIASPLTSRSIARDGDGACAVVLARSDAPAVSDADPLWLLGSGWASDSYHLGSRRFGEFSSLQDAATAAMTTSGFASASALDLIELNSPTAYHEMMAAEALGLCGQGEGADFVSDLLAGASGPAMGVRGGAFGWKPMAASGMARFIDVVDSVRSGHAAVGLAHGTSGNAWQSHCLCLVGDGSTQKEH